MIKAGNHAKTLTLPIMNRRMLTIVMPTGVGARASPSAGSCIVGLKTKLTTAKARKEAMISAVGATRSHRAPFVRRVTLCGTDRVVATMFSLNNYLYSNKKEPYQI